MQEFHTQLMAQGRDGRGYWGWLARLTGFSRDQVAALNSELAWDIWQTGSA